MLYVTTSWDDGDILDLKVEALLERYGLKGTFYITRTYRKNRLSEEQIVALARSQEVGAHTLTHPKLPTLSQEEQYKEIHESKEWLEGLLGTEVPMFCYPFGSYDAATAEIVREAGFKGARTVQAGYTALPTTPYEMPTTLQIYPFPFRKTYTGRYYWRRLLEPLFQRYGLYKALGVSPFHMTSWLTAAKAAFDHTYAHGSVFHLWGHSWELEAYGMWEEFEELLRYIAKHEDLQGVTNGELLVLGKEVAVLGEGTYGSWAVVPKGLGAHSVVYAFGVGEDVSWDLAMIKRFGMLVHAFDPSTKSIAWATRNVTNEKFILHSFGLGARDGVEQFYPPPNPKNVSYSTVRKVGSPQELPIKRLRTIMQELGHDHIDVLKMDIEGSEYTAIEDLISTGVRPKQLLVEFHDRFAGKGKSAKSIVKLRSAGYKILHISTSGEEYTFIRA